MNMKHAVYLEASKAEWADLVEKVGLKCGRNKCHKDVRSLSGTSNMELM